MVKNSNNNSINIVDNNGSTPLMCICSILSPKSIKYLLENGADPNMQDSVGNTPLHTIIKVTETNKTRKIIEILLKYSVNLNLKNNKDQTPLLLACLVGRSSKTIKLLVDGNKSEKQL